MPIRGCRVGRADDKQTPQRRNGLLMRVRYFFQRVETLEGTVELDAEALASAFLHILRDSDRYIHGPCTYDETPSELTDVIHAEEDYYNRPCIAPFAASSLTPLIG